MKRFLLLLFIAVCSHISVFAQKNLHASFTVDSTYGCAPVTVHFTSTSTGDIDLYYWEFGDGTVSAEQHPTHVYLNPGRYAVKLIVYNIKDEFDTAYVSDIGDAIYSLPVASIPDQRLYCGAPVELKNNGYEDHFSSSVYTYKWSTGETSRGITVPGAGSYRLTLTACGKVLEDTVNVIDASEGMQLLLDTNVNKIHWVQDSAVVNFKYQVPFTPGTYSSLKWNYGDGKIADFKSDIDNHTYKQPGDYQVSLIATLLPGAGDFLCDTSAYLNFHLRAPYVLHNSWNRTDTALRKSASLTLHANNQGAAFQWRNSAGQLLSTDSIYTIETSGVYKLTISKNGDVITDVIDVANYTLIPSVTSGGDCGLTAFSDMTYADPYPIVKRTWYFGDGAMDSIKADVRHQYAANGTYSGMLIVENSIGVVDTAFLHAIVTMTPVIKLPEDTTIDKGSSLYLHDLYNNTYEYTWSTGEIGSEIWVTKPGLYSVTAKFCNVTVTDSIYVTVEDFSLHIDTAQTSHCGDSLTLTAVTAATPGSYRILWNTGDSTASVRVSETGTYTARILDNRGTVRDTADIFVSLTKPFNTSLQLLKGQQDILLALVNGMVPETGYTYKWFRNGQPLDIPDNKIYYPADTGWYTVLATESMYNCTDLSDPFYYGKGGNNPVQVEDTSLTGNDSLLVAAGFNHSFNADNLFTVQLTVQNPGGRETGLQQDEVINLGTMPGTTKDVAMQVNIPDSLACATSYAVRVVASSPMDTTVWSQLFTIVNQPAKPVITQRGDSLFTSGKYNWQWYLNDKAIEGATSAVYRAKANGAYTVESLNGNGCTSRSSSVSVIITAVGEVTLAGNKVKAFPNPSEGQVSLQFEKPLLKAVTVNIYNLNGRVMYTRTTTQQLQPLDLSGLPKGYYLIELTGFGEKKVLPLILQ